MRIIRNSADDYPAVYVVWQPVLRSDNREAAERRADEFADDRIHHYWDKGRFTGELWKPVLGTRDIPWDVYFLYNPEAQWEDIPTSPDFWMRRMTEGKIPRFLKKVSEIMGK